MVFAAMAAMAQRPAPAVIGGGGGSGGTTTATTYYEQGHLLRAGEEVEALGPNLMGDTVNEYSGNFSFTQSDFNIPGNNALQMAVGRHLAVGTRQAALAGGLFGDWDLEIPHLHTLSGVNTNGLGDWNGLAADGVTPTELRCSQFQAPQLATGGSAGQILFFPAVTWWDGYHMYVPGVGDQSLLGRYPYTGFVPGPPPNVVDGEQPSDGGVYPVLTKDHWQLSCLTTLANGAGEGFMAHAPDGTRYQFDHMVQRAQVVYSPPPENPGDAQVHLGRQEIWILPSQVTDRFGNWVSYTYDTTDPWKVLSISASDGRAITFTYVPGTHRIQTASDGTRTWNYGYSSTGTLQTVTRPDSSTWQFALQSLERDYVFNRDPGCPLGSFATADPTTWTGTIVHPSGATGTFSLLDTWHGRSNVTGSLAGCSVSGGNFIPTYFANYSLVNKTLSGPGMPTMTWTYNYGTPSGSWAPCNGCVSTETVTITDPEGNVTQHIYGTELLINEGLLLTSNEGWNGSSALKTTTFNYALPNAGPYSAFVGYAYAVSDTSAFFYTPQSQRNITQQGVTFTQTVSGFDTFARPTGYTKSSSLGYSKTESTAFYDNTSLWVLGQVASQTINGVQASSTSFYPATALPSSTSTFGKTVASYAFNPDGTLLTVTDGLGNATTYTSYMRGLAQNIAYADATNLSAAVNNIGAITSVTNEAGTTWTYGYDAMGRVASETAPGGDVVAYNIKTFSFVQVPTSEFGIDPNHWRQTITQGNAVTINYFDARWRKLLTTTYDAANLGGTQRMQRFSYDPYNRTTFAAYPAGSIAATTSATPGIATTYDALGRVTQISADSELGTLTTTTQYLGSFQRQVTNPRGYSTTTAYQAFDDPDAANLVSIIAPEGQSTSISRDIFGKALSITRSGSYAGTPLSLSRSYVYDANQLLCKTIDPEIGATIQVLDAANNVAWHATGLSLASTSTCDSASVPAVNQVAFVYDARNRLRGTGFGDGSPSIGRSYTADGLPLTILSNGSTWTYSYNNRRLPTLESLSFGNVYNIGWGYDANGHTSQLTYPDGTVVAFSPDALGEATAVSGYASGIMYQPNGAIAGYTLANGIVHSQTQNTRGLLALNSDVGVLQDAYSYDTNGNVTSIVDQLQAVTTRSMAYDGLDRLTEADDPNVWVSGSYTYDPLDNIRTSVVGARSSTLSYDATNRLSDINTNDVTTGYAYDNQGNITGRGGQSFTFDEGNRLRQASGIASYTYDGLGRRTSSNGSSYRVQVYDQAGQLLYGVQQLGTTVNSTRYVYLGGKEIAETNTSSGTTFISTDALGSPVGSTTGVAAAVSYSCPSGGTLSGNTCITNSSSAATPVYACPAGFTLSGTTCQGTTTSTASSSWSCNGHGSLTPYGFSASGYMCFQVTESTKLSGALSRCEALSGGLPLVATSSTASVLTCTFGPVKVYSCPTGATLSGTNCITPVAQAASISGYTCASGTLSGSTCVTTISAAATANYSCPSGGTLSGASCIVVSRTRYEPYGNAAAGTPPTWIGFTGHVNDADTGLVYMQQRYYDPLAGRFLSVDPIVTNASSGTGFNRYTYVDNDPYGKTDPNGEWSECGHTSICQILDFTGAWTVGNALGADAAYAVGWLTNNQSLMNVASESMSESQKESVLATIALVAPELKVARAAGAAGAAVKAGIYEFISASGKVYVGQSGNIASRLAKHLKSGKLLESDLSSVRIREVSGGKTAREIQEQLRINQLGGIQNLENVRNPIGPSRAHLLEDP